MSARRLLRMAASLAALGPRDGAAKLRDRLLRTAAAGANRRRDLRMHSFGPPCSVEPSRILQAAPGLGGETCAEQVLALAAMHLQHRFDLLGSGWVRVRHGMCCRGIEGVLYPPAAPAAVNPANRDEAARIRAMLPAGYVPIDWHLDFRSGHRWPEDVWYADVRYGDVPGADVKVPWELSRLQHLPVLAQAHALARAGCAGAEPAARYVEEFRAEVLDWIAANPPRWGVNWASPMDVAIRAANLAIAYDLFRASGVEFDAGLTAELVRSLHAHGAHIASNLEWDPRSRGNHYLADVVGLLFIGAYLPRSARTDAWLAFGVQELIAETRFQFLADGTNFEASTSYHRLSAEMVLLGSALVLGLPPRKQEALRRYDARRHPWGPGLRRGPLPEYPTGEGGLPSFLPADHVAQVGRMARFLVDIAKPGPRAHLVGDDDSGRFARLWPACHLPPDEPSRPAVRFTDHRGTVAMATALLSNERLIRFAAGAEADAALAAGLARGRKLANPDGALEPQRRAASSGGFPDPPPEARRRVIRVPGGGLRCGLESVVYPAFGLYILRSHRVYLAVRCGTHHCRTGGHAHVDALAVELCVDGEDWIADPGSYLYTAFPELRNRYRGPDAHFVPRVRNAPPIVPGPGLFELEDGAHASCLEFEDGRFLGSHTAYGPPVYRRVDLTNEAVVVTDWSVPGVTVDAPAGGVGRFARPGAVTYADGYGRKRGSVH